MLNQRLNWRRRHWVNIGPALGQCIILTRRGREEGDDHAPPTMTPQVHPTEEDISLKIPHRISGARARDECIAGEAVRRFTHCAMSPAHLLPLNTKQLAEEQLYKIFGQTANRI